MNCPGCNHGATAVARSMKVGQVVTRHRRCDACGCEWMTEETVRHVIQRSRTDTGDHPCTPVITGGHRAFVPRIPSGSDPDPDLREDPEESGEQKTAATGNMAFPTKSKHTTWSPTPALVAKLQAAFPDVDVAEELPQAALWCENNPTKRKTSRGMPKFLQNWLKTAQKDRRQLALKQAATKAEADKVANLADRLAARYA